MAAAASTPHHYCFDYSSEFCSEEMMLNMQVPLANYDINSSFPHSDCMLVPQFETGFSDFSLSAASDDYSHNQVFEPGEECSGFMVCPNYIYNPLQPAEDWAIQGKMGTKGEESDQDQVKVGRYSVEERKDRILRYLKKRNQRNFNKTIKYACRKTLADKRVRVRGRFAKNNEPNCPEEMLINTTHHDSCYEQSNEMMKYDEDYWLEAAIDNLGQWPYLAS